ncbi:hypothetical protein XO10_06945 [Marinitoga sp. 1135]|uniref:Outer membrane protein beta-barrel domain-containing protein n=1 Tax=Marinitoga piezophila (strain DSM 14283 / JCM 11233 / KA3) TaxID=443254 RepID=H2J3R4_MARPK|nr:MULTISPECIES: hypothetical protein [Marinitoga]AEX85806.1 hypothetical protein Marpi_1407 [Marinitoga piezophila KA3]APT76247.1 hypothetical protein LN42_07515 [Marinitoga sp. 1137]NUU96006.1 hypothetical protein [Marinitoga sp. 1135]NUU97918.1 hypothetical protein [Marinitoga sp. 1138]
MKKMVFMLLVIGVFSGIMLGFEISGSYLKELSGYERAFVGGSVTIGDKDIFGLEIGVFSPEDIINTGEITYLQPTIFFLVQIPTKRIKVFSGISPIIQYYNGEFSIYSYTMYLTKAGISIYLGPFVITGGVNTVFDLSFQQTFGIFGVYGEFGLRF